MLRSPFNVRLRLLRRLALWRSIAVWYHPEYRLPISGIENAGVEPRRADFAAWFLMHRGGIRAQDLRTPARISYADLARVHTDELLESLTTPESLGRIFAADPSDIPVDAVLATTRLACGATLQAARESLRTGVCALNLLGGFHHAGPLRAGGFCPVNDIAVAVAVLRAEGFAGQVVILDTDAHPPDGIAECLATDPRVWMGSISGSDWGPLQRVDETVLPKGTGDDAYLEALEKLLDRMPTPKLAFIIAGGDPLHGDRLGNLALTLDGLRRRDLAIASALDGLPQVWVPGGGYNRNSWKALAGTGLALSRKSRRPIPPNYDPLQARYAWLARAMPAEKLAGDALDDFGFTTDDIAPLFGRRGPMRLLGFYTAEGIEYALFRFGVLEHLQRLGYGPFRVELERTDTGDRTRVIGAAEGEEHVLVESLLEKKRIGDGMFLFVNWTTLRNPRAKFSDKRPPLPGQDAPGLGLAREAAQLYAWMAKRLHLDGVAFRPAWYHMAYSARYQSRFADPARQGRWEAMLRDFKGVPLLEATVAVAEGRVRLNGEPYTWEAGDMISWLSREPEESALTAAERERCRFTIVPQVSAAQGQAAG